MTNDRLSVPKPVRHSVSLSPASGLDDHRAGRGGSSNNDQQIPGVGRDRGCYWPFSGR